MKPVVPPFIKKDGFGTLGLDFDQPALPHPIELGPVTVGAWLTLLLLSAMVAFGVYLALRHHARRAPRRYALRELKRLQKQSEAAALEAVLVLVKAVALDTFGRAQVASLSGARWRAFLIHSAPNAGFEGVAGEALITIAERGAVQVDARSRAALFHASAQWIRRHRRFESKASAQLTRQALPANDRGAPSSKREASHV